jgi:hypothetical protein
MQGTEAAFGNEVSAAIYSVNYTSVAHDSIKSLNFVLLGSVPKRGADEFLRFICQI